MGSSKKELYLKIKELVKGIPEIKHWDAWNNNVIRDGEVTSYPTPAVFYEFISCIWEPSTRGSIINTTDKTPNQSGVFEIALHIVIKKTKKADLDEIRHYDVENLVYQKIHFSELDIIEGTIQRLRSEAVPDHNVLRDWSIVYGGKIIQPGITGIGCELTEATDVGFDIDVDLDIDRSQETGKRGLTINITDK